MIYKVCAKCYDFNTIANPLNYLQDWVTIFFPYFELYVNYPLFRHHRSLTYDVLMCVEAQHFFFVAPIQGHGEMQGHPNFPTMENTFQWTFHVF